MRISWCKQYLGFGVAAAFLLAGCKGEKIQYMPDMADGPVSKPQRGYLDPPEGAVAATAVIYPKDIKESEEQLHSPYEGKPSSEEEIAKGKVLFETFCAVCHGPEAKGNQTGTVTDKFPPPPDITADAYKEKKDGFFFHRITFGSVIMPSYGHAIDVQERWQIILYLRKLQQK